MVKKEVKFICMVVLIIFISSGIAFACYIKNKMRDGKSWCGNCSNKPDITLCCSEYPGGAEWICSGGKDGYGSGRSLEEAVAKTCGCE